jgi:ADP-ribose pyrophosphatase YjhB (NUDIX family)
VIIIDPKTNEIILSESEDREEITPFGGESGEGELANKTAAREVAEETGGLVNPDVNDLLLIDSVVVLPEKYIRNGRLISRVMSFFRYLLDDNNNGITRTIETFVYFLKENDKMPDIEHQDFEEGCAITRVLRISIQDLKQKISSGELKVFPNFTDSTLPKSEKFLKKGS